MGSVPEPELLPEEEELEELLLDDEELELPLDELLDEEELVPPEPIEPPEDDDELELLLEDDELDELLLDVPVEIVPTAKPFPKLVIQISLEL